MENNRTITQMICFDMDGTIADLYSVPNWRKKIREENPTPYLDAKPMWDMEKLNTVLLKLISKGWEIRVITWLAKDSSESYKQLTRIAKEEWLEKYNFPADQCHMIQYGTTKADCIRKIKTPAILVDDNSKVRKGWTLGRTIDPASCDLIAELEKLLEK